MLCPSVPFTLGGDDGSVVVVDRSLVGGDGKVVVVVDGTLVGCGG